MNDQIPVKNVTPVKVHKPEKLDESKRYTARDRIYVRSVKGPLENFRRFFGFFFIALFVAIPWIQYDGHQAVLLNIVDQRFT
ncbi:MAG: cytochrome c oxidase accessory protein CcoG, partial [Pseudomonadota bacterium]|nr:cytochrome c oxidase accessory protein CcoG [Pseudomonadota bacterium]